ncbi:MAG TPA: ABC transporter permease, partial [Dissulfurispiraceae bacterium]
CFLFSSLGVITGMLAKSHEDTATYANFFIVPMAFFSGTFFSVEKVPPLLKAIIYLMPLTHTNILIRTTSPDRAGLVSLSILCAYAAGFFIYGSLIIKRYSE